MIRGIVIDETLQHHPISELPVFFLHPCNTAEAMAEITGASAVTPVQYFQIWIGLVGGCVGLHLSSELVEEMGLRK